MKTSELKRIVEENGYEFEKTEHFIFIRLNDFYIMGLNLHDHTVVLDEGTSLHTNQIKRIMVALIEYSETPLNEREDEKKYLVKISIPTMSDFVIYLNSEENEFILFPISQKFTQQEIDNFPAEIKGAIECGFLRKVEVE